MGLLLNVDYGDYLAKARGREVLKKAAPKYIELEEAVDAYYIHYRRPIFGGRSNSDVWRRFVLLYVNSPYYEKIASMCRLRHRPSLDAAVKLIHAFERYLDNIGFRKWTWWGRGRHEGWTLEGLRQLRRSFGAPEEAAYLDQIFKKLGEVLGRGRSGDPASLAISMASDPRRLRLAEKLAKSLRLAQVLAPHLGGERGAWDVSWDIVSTGSVEKLPKATPASRSLYLGALPLFLYKLATASLVIRSGVLHGVRGLYLLVDKSGSMFSLVGGYEKIVLATAYAIAAVRHFRKHVLRFFDVDIYSEVTGVGDLVDVLSRVAASGGTDLTRAIEAAVEDAERKRLRGYVLHIVTDGEDDYFDSSVLQKARRVFASVLMVLIGERKPPQGASYIRLLPPRGL